MLHTQEAARVGAHDVQGLALEALGNLAFCAPNREILRGEPRVRLLLVRLASRDEGAVPQRVRHAAIRALASLGMLMAIISFLYVFITRRRHCCPCWIPHICVEVLLTSAARTA